MVAAAAPAVAEYPHAVDSFAASCLSGDLTAQARLAAASTNGWRETDAAGLKVAGLGVGKAIDKNYNFDRPEAVTVFEQDIDAHPARLIVATFPAKNRYRTLCALVMRDVANAFVYKDELGDAFKALGIKGKSVDLPHYFEWAGKVGSDNVPVRGEVFTRSQALGGKRDMHIYVAF
ncbi:MAG TPA: hypothetical protein VNS79_13905 [Sphingobium sp.]|nr:hypothetical protein [Sphingobium sp.]